ncbi:NADPH-dependent oxidoreductase [Schaalia sp. ZJ1691]|uniref:NADPH-dependent oxidoreductase n=1 Tax=Schaalia sp. ZJ1691 TaxID=2709404 RepID=UPI0013EE19AA|nr:NADPH-dependent oxidoreductase [Schaalia sp. ZJ1691]
MENDTIRTQMSHRTIRAFTDEPVDSSIVTTLLDVARHTATSSFLQQMTVIRITDPAVREEIYRSSGQPYVGGTRGELFIFVVDLYRNARIREEAGTNTDVLSSTNLFLCGVEDAILAAQNTALAAESLGLGTVFLGSITGDPRRVITALKLPRLTFPLLGLLVGHPDQDPQYKPRLPISVMTAENTYPHVESYADLLADYNSDVTKYYDLRDGGLNLKSFSTLVTTAIGTGDAHTCPMLDILHEQGLALH